MLERSSRRRKAAVISAALLVAIVTASCSDDGGGGTASSPPANPGCDEVHALQDSLTALTQVDPVSDGTDALKAAATQVGTDLDAAASAVSSELKPSVDQVKTAFDGLASALAGVSSGGGLGEAATAVGASLTQLGHRVDRPDDGGRPDLLAQ